MLYYQSVLKPILSVVLINHRVSAKSVPSFVE